METLSAGALADGAAAATASAVAALAGARSLLTAIDHGDRAALDAEARLALVTEVVALGRQVEALRAVLVGEADRAKAAEKVRGASIKTILAVSSKVTAGEAYAWVHAGAEITAHPRVAEATLTGEVSVLQARAIDRVLRELPDSLSGDQRIEAESFLLDQAHLMDAKDLARQTPNVVSRVAPEIDAIEDELVRLDLQRQHAWKARSLVFSSDGYGSVLIRGQLPTVEGEAFQRLVEAHTLSDRRALEQAADRTDATDAPRPGQRTFHQRTADGLIALVTSRDSADNRAASARPSVVVTLSWDALSQQVEQAGVLGSGERISAGELRRLACDAEVVPVVLGATSEPLDVGREHRLVTPGIRRALETRDRGCSFPGCIVPPSGCEAHHIVPWWAGGSTVLRNLVLLCPHHHATVEPLRFFGRDKPRLRWTVHIGHDGHPQFLAPAENGADSGAPMDARSP
ncbi:MAG: DUF222 domain-containing protein [Propionibacteriaceae bacterium]|nr:DUF222 domain-containing protein [Propionibacteriaceae bacterium]